MPYTAAAAERGAECSERAEDEVGGAESEHSGASECPWPSGSASLGPEGRALPQPATRGPQTSTAYLNTSHDTVALTAGQAH